MNARTETPHTSDEQFLEEIQIATLALELEEPAPQVRPSALLRFAAWFAGIFKGGSEP